MRSLVVCALLASAAFADEGADKEESRRLPEHGPRGPGGAPGGKGATRDEGVEPGDVATGSVDPDRAPPAPAPAVAPPARAPAAPAKTTRRSLRPGAGTLGVLTLAMAGAGIGVYL